MLKSIKKLAFVALASIAVIPAAGQDLLANQAPIDRKMKAIDSIALQRLLDSEIWESPAADLYNDWNNKYAHQETTLPDSFLVNLRDFCMPTTSRVITSNFGSRWKRQHKGLDIKVYIGDTIRAAFPGKVRIVRNEGARKGYGKYVVIRHTNGLETIYGHLSAWLVEENQEVRAGDPIALGGNTGKSTGSHLHFETRLCGVALNPAIMFDFKNQDVIGDQWMFRRHWLLVCAVLAASIVVVTTWRPTWPAAALGVQAAPRAPAAYAIIKCKRARLSQLLPASIALLLTPFAASTASRRTLPCA